MGSRMTQDLVLEALRQALWQRWPDRLLRPGQSIEIPGQRGQPDPDPRLRQARVD